MYTIVVWSLQNCSCLTPLLSCVSFRHIIHAASPRLVLQPRLCLDVGCNMHGRSLKSVQNRSSSYPACVSGYCLASLSPPSKHGCLCLLKSWTCDVMRFTPNWPTSHKVLLSSVSFRHRYTLPRFTQDSHRVFLQSNEELDVRCDMPCHNTTRQTLLKAWNEVECSSWGSVLRSALGRLMTKVVNRGS